MGGGSIQVNIINIVFYDETGERIGFLKASVIEPYNEYITWELGKLTKKKIKRILKTRNVWKIDRRKNDRVHPKSYKSVGYVCSGNNIFPWTIIDAGYKDVFSMSDILWYDNKNDRFISMEIRIFGHDNVSRDMLYGILKTMKF